MSEPTNGSSHGSGVAQIVDDSIDSSDSAPKPPGRSFTVRWAVALVAVVVVAAISGYFIFRGSGPNGSGSTAPTSATTVPSATSSAPTGSQASSPTARQYLEDVASANTAIPAFGTKVEGWSTTTSVSTAQAEARPLEAILTTTVSRLSQLARQDPQAATVLTSEIQAVNGLETELRNLTQLKSQGVVIWVADYRLALTKVKIASDTARTALGLSHS